MSGPLHRGQKNTSVYNRFMDLPLADENNKNKIQVEYIWIDGTGEEVRSKTRTVVVKDVNNLGQLPDWNFDGSSTNQAVTNNSEVWLRPVKVVPDPFRTKPHVLALCECLDPKTEEPIASNLRRDAKAIFDKDLPAKPWFGIEQEYTLFESDGQTPLGWPRFGFPGPQGPYYCGVGARKAYGRQIVDAHYRACLYAGIDISGVNAEVMPGQWEFQVGPCEGIDSGDQLWLARYILERVCEAFDTVCSFSPKPVRGDWNGAGCHTNYSTAPMREEGGYKAIVDAVEKLGKCHSEMMEFYGKGNRDRLTGHHETAHFDKFSWGVANRGASIRVPAQVEKDGKGYFEDRRPAANMDPYAVTSKLFFKTHLE